MKFDFTDFKNRYYQFELDAEPGITDPHVEVTVYRSPTGSSTTIRHIVDGKVQWWEPDDQRMVSLEARLYLDKVIKNKAFL
jgi:hypothetical protein